MPISKKSNTKKSGAKKTSARKTTPSKSASGKSSSAPRSLGKGLMKPMQPDAKLAAIVGAKPMPRTEITKKVWDYIKSNNLQDPENRRMINADDNLRQVLGGKKRVSMFEMTKLVSQHIK